MNRTKDLGQDLRNLTSRDRLYLALILSAVAVFTIVDVVVDSIEGAHITHMLGEVFTVGLLLSGNYLLWRKSRSELISANSTLKHSLIQAHKDAAEWRAKAGKFVHGLNQEIDQQLSSWSLSAAEKDVALLLLKGLSLKEIAESRETSEKTIRQQASAVYRKSGTSGRTEFAAFFLEDLLVTEKQ